MSIPFELIQTADIEWREGQPYSLAFDDIYFSKEHGLEEAQHVFIHGNDLVNRWQNLPAEPGIQFVIAETGFGSGLNFLLTWHLWKQHAPASARLHFISCEKHPLSREDLSRCATLWPDLRQQADDLLLSYPVLTPGFHFLQFEEGMVNLTLMLGDVLSSYRELLICGDIAMEKKLRHTYVDAWFLDGFSPAKNPSMWGQQLFTTMGMLSKKNTTVTTFSAAGVVKDGLQAAGFKVSKQRGYSRKRDMVMAEFENLSPQQQRGKSTPWHTGSVKAAQEKRALVIGAGLAGCYTAYALARRGWLVTLIDEHQCVGSGASGNKQAILYPKLSSFYSPLNAFMLSSYLFAVRTYKQLLHQWPIGELSGMLQLADSQKALDSQLKLNAWLTQYPELATLVDAEQASTLSGLLLNKGGLFILESGWLDTPALCQHLVQMKEINCVGNTNITSLDYDGHAWHANDYHGEILVLANGYKANAFSQTTHVPLSAVRGQMSAILSNDESMHLQIPLCASGHVLPAREGVHHVGATYHLNDADESCYVEDDNANLAKLKALPVDASWSEHLSSHWAGIRAATPDYLPLVGPVADAALFKNQYQSLATDPKRWLPLSGAYHHGLYLCSGFGSRGLTTIPLSAEWLAATINHEPSCLPRQLIQSISPARFLIREIKKSSLAI